MRVLGGLHHAAVVLLLWLFGSAGAAAPLEPVTLQLKWKHAFQFAGYYAAQELGYYREAGLEVRFLEAGPGVDPVQVVVRGGAQFGVSSSNLLRQRAEGAPVVAMAVLFQRSPYIFLVQSGAGITQVRDLEGRRVAMEPAADELKAFLRKSGADPGKLKLMDHHQSVDHFVDGVLDAMSAYTTDEPDHLALRGMPYLVFDPRSAGINFLGDNLFTTEQEIQRHPRRVQAFLEASLRGWRYALDHPEDMVERILARYAPDADREHLRFEARETVVLMQPDLVEVGYNSAQRWRHIGAVYADLGMMPRNFALEGFLYKPPTPRGMLQVLSWMALPAVALGVAVFAWLGAWRRGRALKQHGARQAKEAEARSRQREALERLAATDLTTGTWNRRHLEGAGRSEVERSHRCGQALSLLFIDLDRFRGVNDRFGHQAGDELLGRFCTAVQGCLRVTDVLGRWGGDEFLVLAPGTGLASALLLGERIRRTVEDQAFGAAGILTVCVGVAQCRPGEDWETLVGRADRALYRAKEAGPNQVECVSDFALVAPSSFLQLIWNPSYASGHTLIDAQHMELFHGTNEVLQLVVAGGETTDVILRLQALVEQVALHFETEIRILRAAGFADVEAHAARHEELLRHARGILDPSRRGAMDPRDMLAFVVCDVVVQHMLQEDARFFPIFN